MNTQSFQQTHSQVDRPKTEADRYTDKIKTESGEKCMTTAARHEKYQETREKLKEKQNKDKVGHGTPHPQSR